MGVRAPETCWAVNKRQDNKLEKLLHLVGDLFELYDDARAYKLYMETVLNFYVEIINLLAPEFYI
jgi:hypothetical protein